ncbi:MAG: mismatch-specific DNA-glycosylase [Solirubrobacterales bacterium]|nr:mismatch-specific DNA-glycosylase [Solirubrobacterales bacterium]OJU94479.1 MAG: mismatch-specific DNA-glycosylase [Solirubrobacterales bacterium 67-14]
MRFTQAELEAYRDEEVDDLVGPDLKLLFVGINPGLWTAAVQTHFAHPTNRFYQALAQAGITEHEVDRVAGMTDADRAALVSRGIGITNLVRRATARASELSHEELRSGGEELLRFVAEHQPAVVAIAGITAYRQAFDDRTAVLGRQPDTLDAARWSGAALWVVPNPSGLNAHETVATLAAAYAAPAREAGVLVG